MLCSVYKLGGSLRGGADRGLGIGQRVVSNCIVHHLSFLGYYFFFSVIFLFITIIIILILYLFLVHIIFYFTLVIKLFLSQPTSFTFVFPILLPIPLGREGVSGCVVLSCWLGSNHDRKDGEGQWGGKVVSSRKAWSSA